MLNERQNSILNLLGHNDQVSVNELAKQLTDLARAQIGPIATIDVIQWAEQLPKTRSGKIMRRVLKAKALGLTAHESLTARMLRFQWI